MNALLKTTGIWIDKHLFDEAEKSYYEKFAKDIKTNNSAIKKVSLAGEFAKARERIKQSLENVIKISLPNSSSPMCNNDIESRMACVEDTVNLLKQDFERMNTSFTLLKKLVQDLDKRFSIVLSNTKENVNINEHENNLYEKIICANHGNDEDVDLFGSESENEDEKTKNIKEKLLADYTAKKSTKPAVVAKSNIILDVKPWDDETDMKKLENAVRNIVMDGFIWGASKLVPLAYGISKLQISCVVEDDKVSVDELQERIQDNTDYVQSVDIAAFNKV